MRGVVALVALLAIPTAMADPATDLACSVEAFLTDTAEACAELRDPARAANAAACAATTGECEPMLDVALEDGWGTYYVSLSPPGVFRETNGCAGFQADATECGDADAFVQPLHIVPHGN